MMFTLRVRGGPIGHCRVPLLRERDKVPGEDPHRYGENMQTPHRKIPGRV